MAERIVSPGVCTRERDLSFLPQGIADIGACIIGPTLKGPAFVPTQISNFPEFEEMFGSTTKDLYTPYAVEQYLRSAGTVTIVRVLNTSGYSVDSLAIKDNSPTKSPGLLRRIINFPSDVTLREPSRRIINSGYLL